MSKFLAAISLKYTLVYVSITVAKMEATTIKIHQNTKTELDKFREYKNESYEEVIQKVLFDKILSAYLA